jgi:hypothetical protein
MLINFISDKMCAGNTEFPNFTTMFLQQLVIKSISDLKFII